MTSRKCSTRNSAACPSATAVVVLCDLEDLSYEQAARSLGWPMGTVKSRLRGGVTSLRTCVALPRRGTGGRLDQCELDW